MGMHPPAGLSAVDAWAAQRGTEIEQGRARSASGRRLQQARGDAAIASLRAIYAPIQTVPSDPAPLVCLWLTLPTRAAQSVRYLCQTKDAALRRPVAAAVPSVIPCVDDGDTPGSVWLCDKCRDAAGAYGLHPLDSIDEMGP